MQVADKINSVRAARAAFLAEIQPDLRARYRKGQHQNLQCGDVRAAWCDWLDNAARDKRITAHLAAKAEL